MNYIKITKTDIANGVGVRCVLWVAGCDLRCAGCHNPDSWSFNAGQLFTDDTLRELDEALTPEYIAGLTISGGHPLAPPNIDCVNRIITHVRTNHPNKNIWLYTGYDLNERHFTTMLRGISPECREHNAIHTAVSRCDVVVDGAYKENLRNITLQFRGSSNQRVIDVKRTVASGKITLITDCGWGFFRQK